MAPTIGLLLARAALIMFATAAPAQSSAKVVVGRAIAGVKLGDTKRHVRAVLGKPRCLSCARGKVVWRFGGPLFGSVGFDPDGRVYGMSTKSPRQQTRKGIHPASSRHDAAGRPLRSGSSKSRVMRAYPHARCGVGPQLGNSFQCTVSSRYRRRAVTTRFFGIALPGYGVSEIDIEFG
jgi:hypothetical protein